MTSEELKAFCKERNLTYKELAEKIGMTEGSLKNAIATNNITKSIEHSLGMYNRILELEAEVKQLENLRAVLKELLKI
ncbi:Uncharacterised protein [Campylobacter hyointestinalis subsp. hyointestinalis]|uniref:hypothetical protein n=1 Tax=Campylobacter hyointestinalis TaxID=198 RepID=UPI000724DC31|nr:hypothetical protein [Campylobacter hyointestinalis]CUU88954.1 Uncharacterised protein [Campylobacter hyointestinalis subsp. hyointestinalis]